MKRIRRWFVGTALGLGALLAIVLGVGWFVPVEHSATAERLISAPQEAVWRAMTEIAEMPAWRSSVDRVEPAAGVGGRRAWREIGSTGVMTLEVTESTPPARFVTRIADEGLPFGGTWTYELTPVDGGTRVRITEDGEIYSPLFRFVARFVIGYDGTMRTYLDDLEAYLVPSDRAPVSTSGDQPIPSGVGPASMRRTMRRDARSITAT